MKFILYPAKFFLYFILSLFVLAGSSCMKDKIDLNKISSSVSWNPKLGMPLAYGSLSLKDIIESRDSGGLIKTYPDGLLYLAYRNSLLPSELKTAGDLIVLPDQSFPMTYAQNLFSVLVPGSNTISLRQSQTYTLKVNNGEEIDSVFFKGGTLSLSLQSTFHFTGTAKITLPSLTLNGTPFSLTIPIDKADGTFQVTIPADISRYKLVSKIGGVSNRIPVNFDIDLQNNNQPISGQVTINVGIKNILFQSLFGYLGKFEALNLEDVLKLNIFGNTSNENVVFADPKLRLYASNSFGMPVQILINKLYTSDKNTTSFFDLTLAPAIKTHIFNYPTTVGAFAYDTLKIDKTTSNLDVALASYPAYLFYGLIGTVNPNGKVAGNPNFVNADSHLGLDFEIELPMNLKAGKYELKDTMDMDLSSVIKDVDIVKSLLLHSIFTNYMPFDLKLQVILTNDKFEKLDSLFTPANQPIIKSGTVDTNGVVSKAGVDTLDISFTNARIKPLQDVKHALIRASLNTANNGQTFVKFYKQYRLDVSFGAQTELDIKSTKQL